MYFGGGGDFLLSTGLSLWEFYSPVNPGRFSTTFTAALATVGGSTATRRISFAHVIYNVLTDIMAFILLIPLVWLFQ